MNKLVLFDFDGTLTKKDSLPLFIKFYSGWLNYFIGFSYHVIPIIAYKIGFLSGEKLKQKVLSWFFKETDELQLRNKGDEFVEFLFDENLFNKPLIEKLKSEIAEGNTVAVVSASPEIWISAFCKKMQTDCLSTELEFRSGKFTGKLSTPNCTGKEKVKRILEKYTLASFKEIHAYGNSIDDHEMMALANKKFIVRKNGEITSS